MADDFSVFDMAGAPLAVPLLHPVTAAATQLELRFGDLSLLRGDAGSVYVQIGSEWMKTGDVTSYTRPAMSITQTVNATDTVVTVDSSSPVRANADIGVTDRFHITTSGGTEVFAITRVVDGTHVAVLRAQDDPGSTLEVTAPVTHPVTTPVSVNFMDVLQLAPVQRGVFGTAPAAHAAWQQVTRLYRPADFVIREARPARVRVTLRVAYSGSTIRTFRARAFLPQTQYLAGTTAELYFDLPLPAGATVYLEVGGVDEGTKHGVEMYVSQTADANGIPTTTAGQDWGATGTGTVPAGATSTYPTLTSDSGVHALFSRSADNQGIVISTAGHYLFDLSAYRWS